jgi:hypothetical protein
VLLLLVLLLVLLRVLVLVLCWKWSRAGRSGRLTESRSNLPA